MKGVQVNLPRSQGPVDVSVRTPTEYLEFQIKYHWNAEDTAKAISNPKYKGLLKIVPSDQLEGVKEAAYRLYLKNLNSRPEQASQYLHTYQNVSDRLHGLTPSVPLSEVDALRIVEEIQRENFDLRHFGLTSENFIQWSDIVRESGQATFNAALISAVLKTAPHLFFCFRELLAQGKLTPHSFKNIGMAALEGSAEGALRGGIAAAITSSCRAGLLGKALTGVNHSVVGAATVVAINAIHNAIGLYQGKLTYSEFTEACIRDSFVIGLNTIGGMIGQAIIPVPLLGALIGNLVGSMFAVVVWEGAKQVFFSFFIHSGISFFGLVKQDYTIPAEVLRQAGFDLIEFDTFQPDLFQPDTFQFDAFQPELLNIKVLKRGMLSINTVGYV
jgi:hypothetical protein